MSEGLEVPHAHTHTHSRTHTHTAVHTTHLRPGPCWPAPRARGRQSAEGGCGRRWLDPGCPGEVRDRTGRRGHTSSRNWLWQGPSGEVGHDGAGKVGPSPGAGPAAFRLQRRVLEGLWRSPPGPPSTLLPPSSKPPREAEAVWLPVKRMCGCVCGSVCLCLCLGLVSGSRGREQQTPAKPQPPVWEPGEEK